MGNYFWDTSALVKRYHLEAGTDEVNALLQREDVRVYISDLSIIEIHSALARKVRKGSLAEEGYWKACGFFPDEVGKGIFAVEEVGDGTKRRAVELLSGYALKQGLRTLDALQLAAALDVKERDGLEGFVSADGNFLRVAEQAGLATLNPQGRQDSP